MLTNWPRYDQEDLPRFVDYLESQLAKDEQIVQFEIINKSSASWITIEPVGNSDEFPVGSNYKIVALVRKNKSDLVIETGETIVFVNAYNCAAVFNNGIATMAYQK